MKWSNRILIALLILMVAGMLASNMVLKKEYDKVDKNDTYWTYTKVLEQHFKYLKIKGGNITNVRFEQSPHYSVRVSNDWQHFHVNENLFNAFVSGDTLYMRFTYAATDLGEKNWMEREVLVRIFAPELLYVDACNTNFEMLELKQKNVAVDLSGKSNFEVESLIPGLDTLNLSQKDSAGAVFEMSPEYKTLPSAKIKSSEAMTIRSLHADLQGNSLLDVGHAQIQSIKLNIADSAAIIFSGGALRKFCSEK
jgi:hypothetical protein